MKNMRGYLNILSKECVETSEKSGFVPRKNISNLEEHKWYLGTKIARIGSECSEMLEALRVNDRDELIKEGADVIIITLEFLGCLKDVDIDKEVRKKIEYNKTRPFMHGGKIF